LTGTLAGLIYDRVHTAWGLVLLLATACGPPGRAGLTTGRPDPGYAGPSKAARRAPDSRALTHRPAGVVVDGASPADRCSQLLPIAKRIGRKHKVDLGLIVGVMRVESRFRPGIKNKRSGASGLMQIMPSTGKYFRCGDLLDAEANLICGVRVLKRYIDYFDGDTTYGIAAYHAGPRSPARARKRGKLPKNYSYVQKVLKWRTRFLRSGCF
jgi:hypothetical protein